MKISEMWKEKMKEIMQTVYGKEFAYSKDFDSYLNNEIAIHKDKFPELWMRNLYTTENFSVKLDDIFDIIEKNDLCISGNNTLTYSLNKVPSTIPKILIKQKGDRNLHKKKMLKAKEENAKLKKEGTFFKGCPTDIIQRNENGLQLKIKAFMNSIYGVQGQKGSLLFSPDTAGAVTSQGRNLIAEMTWTMERLLYGTLHFSDINEMLGYLNAIRKQVKTSSEYDKYITYIPSRKEVKDRMYKVFHDTIGFYEEKNESVYLSLFYFIERANEKELTYLYYANNLFDLISKNIRVFDLFDEIIKSPIPYLAPAYKPDDDTYAKYSYFLNIPFSSKEELNSKIEEVSKDDSKTIINLLVWEKINPILKEICDIITEFVLTPMSTPKRCLKYQTQQRRGIVVSDTDSVIINLHPYVKNLSHLHSIRNNILWRGEHVGFYDEDMDFKLINIMSYICTFGTIKAGDVLAKMAYVPENFRKWIDMKNEFLFQRLAMYTGAKKNYVVRTRLQEGKAIDEVSPTGIKINSSIIHPIVKEKLMDTIENKLLKCENINPVDVLHDVKNIEKSIIDEIKAGDFTLGRKARYSGPKGYKTGVYRSDAGRSAFIWNILYPHMKIESGSYGYIFPTIIYTENDVRTKMMSKYPVEAKMLIDKVFSDSNLAQYGLRSIMIPMNDNMKKLPEWLIPYIDYAKLTNKHMQPLISLLPSIGLKSSAISSSKRTYSPLISFS